MWTYDKSAIQLKSESELIKDTSTAYIWLLIAAGCAFLASAFFVVKYFAGGTLDASIWTNEQWMNAMVGLGITAVITAAQAFLYQSGYKGSAAIAATCIVVFFGIFSEISQSMEREDATVRHRSADSQVFQAAVGSIQQMAASNPSASLAPQIAEAAQRLAQCESKLKQKKEKHCDGDKAALSALQEQAAIASQGKSIALASAVSQAKALEYDEDKHYAMIRLIKDVFGLTGIWASFLFSVVIIGTFEYAFHFVGVYVADHKAEMRRRGLTDLRVDTQENTEDTDVVKKKLTLSLSDKTTYNYFCRLWAAIISGEVNHISLRQDGQPFKFIRSLGYKGSNESLREMLNFILDALEKEGVLMINPKYDMTDPSANGTKPKYLIVKNSKAAPLVNQ